MSVVQSGPARFDPALCAWILTTHADVSEALREPRLAAGTTADVSSTHSGVREAVAQSLSRDRLAAIRDRLERSAHDTVMHLPTDRAVDLMACFARPWSLGLAVTVTGASTADAPALADLAARVFRAAAESTDGEAPLAAQAAAAELAGRLPGSAATAATINVQTFVALAQTLPHLLTSAWLALFGDPAAVRRLRTEPGLMRQAVEELLRHAGPSRAVFRRARSEVRIGDATIGTGDTVILMLAAANHDSARFANPDCLDFDRGTGEHLAFGGGGHFCSGARLIRVAVAAATGALLQTTAAVELTGAVEWMDGFAIRAPASLTAVLRRTPAARANRPPPIAKPSP